MKPGVWDGLALKSRPGEKHGPNETGAAGPCDADCLKCAMERAAAEFRALKRDPYAAEQIATARSEAETPDLDAMHVRSDDEAHAELPKHIRDALAAGYIGEMPAEPAVSGPVVGGTPAEMTAFAALRAAAREAHAAQQALATTSNALREAFGAFCKAVTE